MPPGRPKECSEGKWDEHFLIPISKHNILERYSSSRNLSKTNVIILAIGLIESGDADRLVSMKVEIDALKKRLGELEPKAKEDEAQDEMIRNIYKLNLTFEVTKFLNSFDKAKFGSYPTVQENAERILEYIRKVKTFELDEELSKSLGMRLKFIYELAIPDVMKFMYEGDIKHQDTLWYNYRDYANNNFTRPPIPPYMNLKGTRRGTFKWNIGIAKGIGEPYYDGSELKPLLGHTIKETPRLEHKPKKKDLIKDEPVKASSDSEFDRLMEGME
jgi:hypothetical protein